MKDLTYDVRFQKTYVYKGKRGNTYTVRWTLDGKPRSRVFKRSAQADAFRGEIQAAARKGEAFDVTTGEPVSWARSKRAEVSWYDFACRYVDMKWKAASGKYRESVARAMVIATQAMVKGNTPVSDVELRRAMNHWGFNTKRRDDAPPEVAEQLRWLSANTRSLTDLTLPGVARELLESMSLRLDGHHAAASTVRKHRMLLANALDYAVELELLEGNPVRAIKWRAPSTTIPEVDRRSVVNHRQAKALLEAVRVQVPSGPRLVAFFGLMYYAGLRPEEAVSVRHRDLTLPPTTEAGSWGELRLTHSAPHVGRRWTDDDAIRELRALKHRDAGETRVVPISPELVALLRAHVRAFPERVDGHLFYGVHSEALSTTTYLRAWRAARKSALSARDQASPLARRPYDLRHAAVSTWLNAGVPAPQVAEWAGHSVDVLLRIYAKCIEGQQALAKKRIAMALAEGLGEPAPDYRPSTDHTVGAEGLEPPTTSL